MKHHGTHTPFDALRDLREFVRAEVADLDDNAFETFISAYHAMVADLKDAVFDKRNQQSRTDFEDGWAAQSIQYAIDCIPDIHRIMKTHYRRKDDLSFLDVGAGSGSASHLFAMLHSGRHVYAKLKIDALDHTDSRQRWIKTLFPAVNTIVAEVGDLPKRHWDLVYCSHVIEHVPHPRRFLQELVDVCRGFLFVYAPYNETDRIPGHCNTITESEFEGFDVVHMRIMKSMGWHADIPDDKCILVVIDCRR